MCYLVGSDSDGGLAAELDGNGNVVATFVYGTKANVPDYAVKNSVTYRIISDHLGSPVMVIGAATGGIVEQAAYDEYGYVLNDPLNLFDPEGFAGVPPMVPSIDPGEGGDSPQYTEEPGLEEPILSPIDLIPGSAGVVKFMCIFEGKSGKKLFQLRLKKSGEPIFRFDKDKRGFHYHRHPDMNKHRPRQGW